MMRWWLKAWSLRSSQLHSFQIKEGCHREWMTSQWSLSTANGASKQTMSQWTSKITPRSKPKSKCWSLKTTPRSTKSTHQWVRRIQVFPKSLELQNSQILWGWNNTTELRAASPRDSTHPIWRIWWRSQSSTGICLIHQHSKTIKWSTLIPTKTLLKSYLYTKTRWHLRSQWALYPLLLLVFL